MDDDSVKIYLDTWVESAGRIRSGRVKISDVHVVSEPDLPNTWAEICLDTRQCATAGERVSRYCLCLSQRPHAFGP